MTHPPKNELILAIRVTAIFLLVNDVVAMITPGAADYPYSDFVSMSNHNRTKAVAGELNFFIIQAKDAMGNLRTIPIRTIHC